MVSVVIPVHNGQAYLGDAIDSALSQSWKAIEVVVVDDASTDESLKIAQGYGHRIRIIRLRASQGPGGARNRGIAAACGEYVQFLDADDLLDPQKIAHCLAAQHGSIDSIVVFCDQANFRYLPNGAMRILSIESGRGFDPSRSVEGLLRFGVHTARPLHRRSQLLAVGGFSECMRYLEDFDLHVRLALSGAQFRYLPGVMFLCREHQGPRLRNSPGAARGRVDGNKHILLHTLRQGYFTPELRRMFAHRFAYAARRAYEAGEIAAGDEGIRLARALHSFPRASSSGAFNLLAWLIGLRQAERLVRPVARFRFR